MKCSESAVVPWARRRVRWRILRAFRAIKSQRGSDLKESFDRVVFQQEAPRGYSPQPLAAFHQTAALFAGGLPATRPDPRRNIPFTALSYHISAVCQGGFRKNPREKYPLTGSGTAGRCSGRCRPGTAPGCGTPAAGCPAPRERRRCAAPCPLTCARRPRSPAAP